MVYSRQGSRPGKPEKTEKAAKGCTNLFQRHCRDSSVMPPELRQPIDGLFLVGGVAMPAEGATTPCVDPAVSRAGIIDGISALNCETKETVFSQGDPSDAVFYVRRGRVELTVVSRRGKEAIVGVSGAHEFVGEQSLAGEMFRSMTARAVERCTLIRVERARMLRMLREDSELPWIFISYLLSRNMRLHEALVDHFFNHSEKRLARLLLSLAHYGKQGQAKDTLPKVNQETLAEMVGTTRGRISFFMNKFRKQGLIEYSDDRKGVLRIHSSLLNVLLHD